jgi:hypothetical protein
MANYMPAQVIDPGTLPQADFWLADLVKFHAYLVVPANVSQYSPMLHSWYVVPIRCAFTAFCACSTCSTSAPTFVLCYIFVPSQFLLYDLTKLYTCHSASHLRILFVSALVDVTHATATYRRYCPSGLIRIRRVPRDISSIFVHWVICERMPCILIGCV